MGPAGRDAIHPVRRRSSDQSKCSRATQVSIKEDFGLYQILLLCLTQFGYIPVAASMLSASFLMPSKDSCKVTEGEEDQSVVKDKLVNEGQFHSLLFDWEVACHGDAKSIQTVINETLMLGGLVGAFVAGYFADRFGRKPVIVGSMVVLVIANVLILFSHYFAFFTSLPTYSIMGGACGAYMTTNLVLVVESLCSPSSRLLVVALNGWSLSMVATGGLAWVLPYWQHYHAAIAVLAAVSVLTLFLVTDESLRWLRATRKMTRYDLASARLAKFNGEAASDRVILVQLLDSNERLQEQQEGPRKEEKKASYIDLLKEKHLRPRLFAVAYCFFTSSIVSFGFYFAVDALAMSRSTNLAVMGAGKFLTGLLPFVVSSCCSRKQIALASVAIATLAAWTIAVSIFAGVSLTSLLPCIFSILVAASLDPTWKISHLYSTELFPTNMRNMARGFCNAAGRTGSVLAPLVNHFRHDLPSVPFTLFAVLLTGQFIVILFFLPKEVPADLDNVMKEAMEEDGDEEEQDELMNPPSASSSNADVTRPLSP